MRIQRVGASSVGSADVALPGGGRVLSDRQPIVVHVGAKQRKLIEVGCTGRQRSRRVRAGAFRGAPPAWRTCANWTRRLSSLPPARRRLAAVVFRASVGEVRCIHQGHRVQVGAYR